MQGGAGLIVLLLALLAVPQRALGDWPTVTWEPLKVEGYYNYKWTLAQTVNGAPAPGQQVVRLDKGAKQNIPYRLSYTRTVDVVHLGLQGGLVITNERTGTLIVTSVTLSLTPTGGAPREAPSSSFVVQCSQLGSPMPPGGSVRCTIITVFTPPEFWRDFLPGIGSTNGSATVSIAFTDDATAPATREITYMSPTFSLDSDTVFANYATATLTNTFDLTPLDQLYTGFAGFVRQSVWRILDPATEIIATAGVTVKESGTMDVTYVAGRFAVCTDAAGISLTNTATLTPQGRGPSSSPSVPITVTGTVNLQVTGCSVAPDVTFQLLQTWAAQSFSWSLAKTAQQSAFTVDQKAGSVPMGYTLRAVAQPTTGSYYVSGALFVNNNRPGILNIARIGVQLSTGQQAVPTCTLTAPYAAADGLVWGAANAGGSVTQSPCTTIVATGNIAPTNNGVTPITAGTVVNTCALVIPEYASATCTFNISLGTSPPGGAIQITPQLSWGFGGQYQLSAPPQQTLDFAPANNFFPVGNCITLTDTAQAPGSSIALSNGFPNNQQVCVERNMQPFQQPAPIPYTVTATVNPSTTPDCQPGGTKTYSITNRATATPIGGTGAPVTAPADPAVTLTVNCGGEPSVTATTPPMTAMTPASTSDVTNLNVVVGGLQKTVTSGRHTWTVAKQAIVSALAVRVGGPPANVTYSVTVTKSPAVDRNPLVAGTITITNPGTKPVDLSLVAVTAGSASVPATCPPDAKQALPSAPVVCTFHLTRNNGANSGSLGARVDTPEASFYGAPAALTSPTAALTAALTRRVDFPFPRRPPSGLTANVYDDLSGTAPPNATGVPTVWFMPDADAPTPKSKGLPLTTADSRTYTYTVQVGPFTDKGSCGSYRLGNIATVEPSDGNSPANTAEAVVSVSVVGCRAKRRRPHRREAAVRLRPH